MRQRKTFTRFHILLAGCCVLAGLYFLVVTLPLVRQEREVDERLQEAIHRLAAAGHGMTAEEVERRIERLRKDIDAFSSIGRDRSRVIQFSPEIEELLARPFQRMDFDYQKFLVIDGIRSLGRERKVTMPDQWEQALPSPGRQPPHQLWAQLAAMEQLLRTAIESGVESIDKIEQLQAARPDGTFEGGDLEIPVRMQLTGPMEAIHSVLMMLPLNGDDLEALEAGRGEVAKSPFFLSRFLLTKSSPEKVDQVTLDFVASGFLEVAPAL